MVRGLSATNGGTQIMGYFDGRGFDFATIDVYMTTSDNATNNPSIFKLGDCDDTNLTSATDITAFVGDGTGGWTVPNFSIATTTNNMVKFNVDLRGLKRYLHLEIVPLTTQTCWAFVNLFRGEQAPDSIGEANVLALVAGP